MTLRSVLNRDQFTPLGLWIRQHVKHNITVSNLDYCFLQIGDSSGKVLLLEEKSNGAAVHEGQKNIFMMLSGLLEAKHRERVWFGSWGYRELDFWGFYVLSFPRGIDMPGPGMKLNGVSVTAEQLQSHLSFEERFTRGWYSQTARDFYDEIGVA